MNQSDAIARRHAAQGRPLGYAVGRRALTHLTTRSLSPQIMVRFRRLWLRSFSVLITVVCGSGCLSGPAASLYVEDAQHRVGAFFDVGGDASGDLSGAGAGGPPGPDAGGIDGSRDAPLDARRDAIDATGGLGPACAAIPELVDFGTRNLGQVHREPLVVENCGGFEARNLVVESIELAVDTLPPSSELALVDLPEFPFSLGPNERWSFVIEYQAVDVGEHAAVVRVRTNDPMHASVDVSVSASTL